MDRISNLLIYFLNHDIFMSLLIVYYGILDSFCR